MNYRQLPMTIFEVSILFVTVFVLIGLGAVAVSGLLHLLTNHTPLRIGDARDIGTAAVTVSAAVALIATYQMERDAA